MGVGYLDAVDLLSIILIVISGTVLIPILLYSLYRFHNISNTEIVKQRNPRIVYAINILTIVCFLTERIFAMYTEIIYYKYHALPFWTVSIGDNLTVIIVYVLCVMRTWLLYYNWKYHKKIVENVWKKDINPDEISWFIRNKSKYGYFKPLFIRIAFIPSITFICIEIAADIIAGGPGIHDHILNMFLPFSLFIVFLYLYNKIKNLSDAFNVRKEIYYQCIVLCVAVVVDILDISVFFVADSMMHDHDYHYLERVEWLTSSIITYAVLFTLSLISTAYPVYLSMQIENQKRLSDSTTPKSYDIASMLNAIATGDGFKTFMNHLVNCLATENLLFITELIQIKHKMQKKYNNRITALKMCNLRTYITSDMVEFKHSLCITIDFNELENTDSALEIYKVGGGIENGVTFSGIFNDKDHLFCKINLTVKLPHSKIVDEDNNFIDQMHYLFNKYVNVGSDHEINISSEARSFLINVFKNLENIKCKENYLFNIMDAACIEILRLCHNSHINM